LCGITFWNQLDIISGNVVNQPSRCGFWNDLPYMDR